MARKRQGRGSGVAAAIQTHQRLRSTRSASVTPQVPSILPETPTKRARSSAVVTNRSITPPTISPITNPKSRTPPIPNEDEEDEVEDEQENGAGDEDDQEDEEEIEDDDEDADDESSPDSGSDSDFEDEASKPKPKPYQPRSYRHSLTDDEDSSSPERIFFEQLNGGRVPVPTASRVRKRAHSPSPSPEDEKEEEEEHYGTRPSKSVDYSKPIVFTPYFKRKDFVPQPPVTGKEEWARGKEWDQNTESFQKIDIKRMREYWD